MDGLTFEIDDRDKNPDRSGHRQARFREGWKRAVAGQGYGRVLKRLTWDNLGWRLGKLFGETSPEQIDEMYDWCVRQYRSKKLVEEE